MKRLLLFILLASQASAGNYFIYPGAPNATPNFTTAANLQSAHTPVAGDVIQFQASTPGGTFDDTEPEIVWAGTGGTGTGANSITIQGRTGDTVIIDAHYVNLSCCTIPNNSSYWTFQNLQFKNWTDGNWASPSSVGMNGCSHITFINCTISNGLQLSVVNDGDWASGGTYTVGQTVTNTTLSASNWVMGNMYSAGSVATSLVSPFNVYVVLPGRASFTSNVDPSADYNNWNLCTGSVWYCSVNVSGSSTVPAADQSHWDNGFYANRELLASTNNTNYITVTGCTITASPDAGVTFYGGEVDTLYIQGYGPVITGNTISSQVPFGPTAYNHNDCAQIEDCANLTFTGNICNRGSTYTGSFQTLGQALIFEWYNTSGFSYYDYHGNAYAAGGTSVPAASLVNGTLYQIQTVGTSNFMLVGAGSNTAGTFFTASGSTTGSGTCATSNLAATGITATRTYEIMSIGTTDYTTVGAPSNTQGLVFECTGAPSGSGTVMGPILNYGTAAIKNNVLYGRFGSYCVVLDQRHTTVPNCAIVATAFVNNTIDVLPWTGNTAGTLDIVSDIGSIWAGGSLVLENNIIQMQQSSAFDVIDLVAPWTAGSITLNNNHYVLTNNYNSTTAQWGSPPSGAKITGMSSWQAAGSPGPYDANTLSWVKPYTAGSAVIIPVFANEPLGNYAINPASLDIAAGIHDAYTPTTDITGATRPNPPSIGAYEYYSPLTAFSWFASPAFAGHH
jgi:hypothetical protein